MRKTQKTTNNMQHLADKYQLNRKNFIRNKGYVRIPEHIEEIRVLLKRGFRVPVIAKMYGRTTHNIADINKNRCWFDPKWEEVKQRAGRPDTKLSPEDIPNIKAAIESGEVMTKIAKRYGVHHQTIRDIKHGRRWQNI